MSLLSKWMWWISLLVASFIAQTTAAYNAGQEPIDTDSQVVKRSTHSVWFDPEKKSIRPLKVQKSNVDVSDRHDWIDKPSQWDWSWFKFIGDLFGDLFAFLFAGWKIILVVAIVLIACVILFVVFRFRGENGRRTIHDRDGALAREREQEKIRDLPFELEQSTHGLFALAEKYRAAGDYSKSIIYLFSHALVEMDHARCIRLARGKTNRVYLNELRGRESLGGFAIQLVNAFELVFFGKHSLSQEAFEGIWGQLPAFDASLHSARESERQA